MDRSKVLGLGLFLLLVGCGLGLWWGRLVWGGDVGLLHKVEGERGVVEGERGVVEGERGVVEGERGVVEGERGVLGDEGAMIEDEGGEISSGVLVVSKGSDQSKMKLRQIFSLPLSDKNVEEVVGFEPGFAGLFDVDELTATEVSGLLERVKSGSRFGTLIFVDQEGGRVQRLKNGFVEIPTWEEVCGYSEEEFRELVDEVARELREVGVDGVWGPVVDRFNQDSRVLEGRTCISGVDEIVHKSLVYVDTMKNNGLMSVVKHYPGLGQTEIDPHFGLGRVGGVDWEVYEELVGEVGGVMVTHVALGSEKLPCTVSRKCLDPLFVAREEGDDFLIMADAMEMDGLDEVLGATESAYLAVMAGVDVLVYGKDAALEQISGVYEGLLDMYINEKLFSQQVDESVERILKAKNELER